MNKALTGTVVAVFCLAAIGLGIYLVHRHAVGQSPPAADDAAAKDESKPVATVSVAPLAAGSLVTHATAFGSVVARPEFVQFLSVPYESQTILTGVSVGQRVTRGQSLLQVRPSVAARATLDDARNAVAAAERDLALVKQRYDQKLATNTELFTAQNAQRAAQNHVNGLTQIDPSKPAELTSDADSIVTRIDAQPGQTIAAGAPLIELISLKNVQAKLAIDVAMISQIKAGQPVELSTAIGAAPLTGTVIALATHFDPASHLVDVFAELPANTLPIDTPLIAKFELHHADGFLVPHDAVVPDDDGTYELFTVKGDKAVKHTVQVVAEDDESAQITATGLKPGDTIVVTGNYILEDGMAVSAIPAPPAATQPASAATRPDHGDEK